MKFFECPWCEKVVVRRGHHLKCPNKPKPTPRDYDESLKEKWGRRAKKRREQ